MGRCPDWCIRHTVDGHEGERVTVRIGGEHIIFRLHGVGDEEIADCSSASPRVHELLGGDVDAEQRQQLCQAMRALASVLVVSTLPVDLR